MRQLTLILVLIVASTLLLGAAASNRWDHVPAKDRARRNPLEEDPEAVAAGALIFRNHCVECHKADAMGDGKKRPALRSQRIRAATDGDIEWFLRQGDLSHGMPSWSSLPEAQRWQLVRWIRSIQ